MTPTPKVTATSTPIPRVEVEDDLGSSKAAEKTDGHTNLEWLVY
jgi:hypothetical protein